MNKTDDNLALGKTIGRVFIGIGSIVAICGLVWLSNTATFVRKASKAAGTVIQMDRNSSRKGDTFYPVYTFKDASGTVHTQHSSIGSSSYTFEPGEAVTILYNSADPIESEIDTFGQVWGFPLLVTGFGAVFGGFACFWLYLVIRGNQREEDDQN